MAGADAPVILNFKSEIKWAVSFLLGLIIMITKNVRHQMAVKTIEPSPCLNSIEKVLAVPILWQNNVKRVIKKGMFCRNTKHPFLVAAGNISSA